MLSQPIQFRKGIPTRTSCLVYSIRSAILLAFSSPKTLPIQASVTSIPALTPDEVQIFPSVTHLARLTHSTSGPSATISFHAILLVVALLPLRTPARAASPEPVQTVIKYSRRGYISLMNSIAASIIGLKPREPRPPGIKRTSSGGWDEYVCVGRISCPILPGWSGHFVVTGSRVDDRSESVILSVWERTLIQSRGPNASSAWKPGNKSIPIRKGSGGGGGGLVSVSDGEEMRLYVVFIPAMISVE